MLGFIGCGNIAGAMIKGVLSAGLVKPGEIIASAAHEATLRDAEEKFQIFTTLDNRLVAEQSSVLVLAVKPKFYESILEEIKTALKPDTLVISVAPGFTFQSLIEMMGGHEKIVRGMPNTPALAGEGMSSLSFHRSLTEEERQSVLEIFESFGKVEIFSEDLMEAASGLAGCSPAFVYMILEAMSDAGVYLGLPRDKAVKMAAQTLLGSATMVLETGRVPEELKGQVTTPGGTTIKGVRKLEEKGLRSAMIEAILASAQVK